MMVKSGAVRDGRRTFHNLVIMRIGMRYGHLEQYDFFVGLIVDAARR